MDGQAAPPGGTFEAISAGSHSSCGLRTDDAVVCWGAGADLVDYLDITDLETISTGDYFTCGLRTDGSIDCWGSIPFGSANTGANQAVSAGSGYACGLRNDGTIRCNGRSAGSIVTS